MTDAPENEEPQAPTAPRGPPKAAPETTVALLERRYLLAVNAKMAADKAVSELEQQIVGARAVLKAMEKTDGAD